jgi:hypothetical protein
MDSACSSQNDVHFIKLQGVTLLYSKYEGSTSLRDVDTHLPNCTASHFYPEDKGNADDKVSHTSTLKIEATCTAETLVSIYRSARCYKPENSPSSKRASDAYKIALARAVCTFLHQVRVTRVSTQIEAQTTECPNSLEPMGILIIFLIFIYRLQLKVKRLKKWH